MSGSIEHGAIIAAGQGSRLRRDGFEAPKPLVEVHGVPLVAAVLEHFRAAGISSVTIIFNEDEEECARFVRERFSDLHPDVIVKSTSSSLESFREVCARFGSARALISTVDWWCSRESFLGFFRAAQAADDDAVVLGVTRAVSDERPLWVTMTGSGDITAIGEEAGELATAGLYVVPPRLRRSIPAEGLERLRHYLRWLVQRGEVVRGIEIDVIFDVDTADDVTAASTFSAAADHERRGPGRV